MTAFYAVTFVMSAVLICKWKLSHYDDDDDDYEHRRPLQIYDTFRMAPLNCC